MYKKILVATDGSELAQTAVEQGTCLAKALGAKIVFVTVTESWSSFVIASDVEFGKIDAVKKFEKSARDSAAKILEPAKSHAANLGVEVENSPYTRQSPCRRHFGGSGFKGLRSLDYGLAWASGNWKDDAREPD